MRNLLTITSDIDVTIKSDLSNLENIKTETKYTFLYFNNAQYAYRVKRLLVKPLISADDIVILDNRTHHINIYP